MKRFTAILVVIVLAVLSQAGQAADLKAGWYVKLASVALYNSQHQVGTRFNFTGDLGASGPFYVSSPDPLWAERMVSVPVSAVGVPGGTSVYLWGTPQTIPNYVIDSVSFAWETNCDSSIMQLQLLMYKPDVGYTLLWSHNQSGYNSDNGNVLRPGLVIPVGYMPVFRVTVVPEPNGLLVLIAGSGALFGLLRRRS